MLEQAGRGTVALYDLTKDLLTRQENVERLDRAAGLDPSARNTLDRLHEAAGLESTKDDQDALDRLNKEAGVDRAGAPSDPTRAPDQALNKTLDGAAPGLEQAAEQHVQEQVMDLGLEILL
jgi:hypothetical protein